MIWCLGTLKLILRLLIIGSLLEVATLSVILRYLSILLLHEVRWIDLFRYSTLLIRLAYGLLKIIIELIWLFLLLRRKMLLKD